LRKEPPRIYAIVPGKKRWPRRN